MGCQPIVEVGTQMELQNWGHGTWASDTGASEQETQTGNSWCLHAMQNPSQSQELEAPVHKGQYEAREEHRGCVGKKLLDPPRSLPPAHMVREPALLRSCRRCFNSLEPEPKHLRSRNQAPWSGGYGMKRVQVKVLRLRHPRLPPACFQGLGMPTESIRAIH